MSEELLNCPFCGKREGHIGVCRDVFDDDKFQVLEMCLACYVLLPTAHGFDTYDEAFDYGVKEWNTRAERTCEGCRYEGTSKFVYPCSHCTHTNYDDCYEPKEAK